MTAWRLVSIEPWSASGPGWANQGITLHEEDADGRTRRRTIYRNDLRGHAAVLFPHLLGLYGAVRREVEAGAAGKVSP